jgi:hypothetical protein
MVKSFAIALTIIVAMSSVAIADTARFSVVLRGQNAGHLIAETNGGETRIDYDYKTNGRGPTMTEDRSAGCEWPAHRLDDHGDRDV